MKGSVSSLDTGNSGNNKNTTDFAVVTDHGSTSEPNLSSTGSGNFGESEISVSSGSGSDLLESFISKHDESEESNDTAVVLEGSTDSSGLLNSGIGNDNIYDDYEDEKNNESANQDVDNFSGICEDTSILTSFLDKGDSSNHKSATGYAMVATDPGSTNKPNIGSTGSGNIGESELSDLMDYFDSKEEFKDDYNVDNYSDEKDNETVTEDVNTFPGISDVSMTSEEGFVEEVFLVDIHVRGPL